MELVILGMLMYIWYIKLFPLDEPFITQTPRWKRSTTKSVQNWISSGNEPMVDKLASYVMKCEDKTILTQIMLDERIYFTVYLSFQRYPRTFVSPLPMMPGIFLERWVLKAFR